MEYPRRPEQHIMEDESLRIFANSIPSSWIAREMTKRDYGIDCYLELVDKRNQVTGDMVFIQLKSTEEIKWVEDGGELIHTLSGIKGSTVNYWLNLPVPVFIFLVDITKKEVYFINIKKSIRRNYIDFLSNKTISFKVNKKMTITRENFILFIAEYLLEKNFSVFNYHLATLFMHLYQYVDFFHENIGRDEFMEVENDAHLTMIHLYETCRIIANQFFIDWNQKSLEERYKEDREIFKDSSPYSLHELTMTRILEDLRPQFIEVIEKAKDYIVGKEMEYWIYTNHPLFNFCTNVSIKYIKDSLHIS